MHLSINKIFLSIQIKFCSVRKDVRYSALLSSFMWTFEKFSRSYFKLTLLCRLWFKVTSYCNFEPVGVHEWEISLYRNIIPYCTMFTSALLRNIYMYWTKEKTSAFKQRTYTLIHKHHKEEHLSFVFLYIPSLSSSANIVHH